MPAAWTIAGKESEFPPPPKLEVHVWAYPVQAGQSHTVALWNCLSADEQARVKRLRKTNDQANAIASRGVLRTLLGRYLGIAPRELVFSYGPQGKPSLALSNRNIPAFNVSHSGDWLLLAFAPPDLHIGIDIEQHRPIPEWQEIAHHTFHPRELAALLAQPAPDQLACFFDCWTRKEAVVKSLGTGISIDLQSFCVPIERAQAEYPVYMPAEYRNKHCTLKLSMPQLNHYSTAVAIYGAEPDGRLPLVCKSIDTDLR